MPALPTSVTNDAVVNRRSRRAKDCCALDATQQALVRNLRDTLPRAASDLPRHVVRLHRSRASTHTFRVRTRLLRHPQLAFLVETSISAPGTSTSVTPRSRSSICTRWLSYVCALTPSVSARMRRFVSIVIRIVRTVLGAVTNLDRSLQDQVIGLGGINGDRGTERRQATRNEPPWSGGTPAKLTVALRPSSRREIDARVAPDLRYAVARSDPPPRQRKSGTWVLSNPEDRLRMVAARSYPT